jgi:hypothetical protein
LIVKVFPSRLISISSLLKPGISGLHDQVVFLVINIKSGRRKGHGSELSEARTPHPRNGLDQKSSSQSSNIFSTFEKRHGSISVRAPADRGFSLLNVFSHSFSSSKECRHDMQSQPSKEIGKSILEESSEVGNSDNYLARTESLRALY